MITSRTARIRVLILVAFGLACAGVITVLYALTGAHITKPYEVTITAQDADNLVTQGRVRIGGVTVGQVEQVEPGPTGARAVISIQDEYAPLHQGVKLRVGNRSLVEESYLEVKDGSGAELPDGAEIPASDVEDSTQVHDLLETFDRPTRDALTATMRSAGTATSGTRRQTGQLVAGLGDLGRQGSSALDAVAAQGEDLKSLSQDTGTILQALDTGQGQIATLVDNADRLTAASADQNKAIEGTVRRLPGVLDSAGTATRELTDLSAALKPVAADLKAAGPPLSAALRQLPETSKDLRSILPPADRVLDRAPATLGRVPTFSEDLGDRITPETRNILRDANPIMQYLRPYGPELGAFFANFNAIFNYKNEKKDHYWRTFLPLNDAALPGGTEGGLISYYNPLPPPGNVNKPGPFQGNFPRLEREPR